MPSITELPPELLLSITERIHRRSDLKNLCLVSKTIRDAATPRLYSVAVLDLNTLSCSKLNGFFAAGNPGPKHVRILTFRPSMPNEVANAHKIMRLAIDTCGKDGLRDLRLPREMQVDEDLFMHICNGLKNLQRIDLGALGEVLSHRLQSSAFQPALLNNVTAIRVAEFIEDMRDLEGYGSLIARTPNLKRLSIITHAFTTYDPERRPTPYICQSEGVESLVFKPLFAAWSGNTTRPAMRLRVLSLFSQDLAYPATVLTKAIDFSTLSILWLQRCRSYGELYDALARSFRDKPPALQVLYAEYCHRGDCAALANLLQSFTGIRAFGVINESCLDFDLSWLANHEPSLNRLAIAAPLHSYSPLTNGFPKVHSLATMMPEVHLSDTGTVSEANLRVFNAAFDTLITSRKREMLTIIGLPPFAGSCLTAAALTSSYGRSLEYDNIQKAVEELNCRRYLERLDCLASQLLVRVAEIRQATTRSALLDLSFYDTAIRGRYLYDAEGEDYEDITVPFEPMTYLPIIQSSPMGCAQVAGMRVPTKEMAYVFPPEKFTHNLDMAEMHEYMS